MNFKAMNSSVDESVLLLLENEESHEGNSNDTQQSPSIISIVIGFVLIGVGLITMFVQIYYKYRRQRQKRYLIEEQNHHSLPHISAPEVYLQPLAPQMSLSSKQPAHTSVAPKVFPLGRLRHAESNVSDGSSLLQDSEVTEKKTRAQHWNMSELSGVVHEDVYAFQASNDADEESQKVIRLISPVNGDTGGKYHIIQMSTEVSTSHDGEDKEMLETTAFGSDGGITAVSSGMSYSNSGSGRQDVTGKTTWEIDQPNSPNVSEHSSQHMNAAYWDARNGHTLQRNGSNSSSRQGSLAAKLNKSRRDTHTMSRKHVHIQSKHLDGWKIDTPGMPKNAVQPKASGRIDRKNVLSDGNSTVFTRSTASRSDGSYTVVTRSTASSGMSASNMQDPRIIRIRDTRDPSVTSNSNDLSMTRNNSVPAKMEPPVKHGIEFVREFNPYDTEEPSSPVQTYFISERSFQDQPQISQQYPPTSDDWAKRSRGVDPTRKARRSKSGKVISVRKPRSSRRTVRSESPNRTRKSKAKNSGPESSTWTLDPASTGSVDSDTSHLEALYFLQKQKKSHSFGTARTSQCSRSSSESDLASMEEITSEEIKADLEELELLRMHKLRQVEKDDEEKQSKEKTGSITEGRSISEVASALLTPQSMQTQVSLSSSVSRSDLKNDADKYACIESVGPAETPVNMSSITDETYSSTGSCDEPQIKKEPKLSDVTSEIQLQVKMLSSFVKSYKKKKQMHTNKSLDEESGNTREVDDLESGMSDNRGQNDSLEEMVSASASASDVEYERKLQDQPYSPSPTNLETNEALQDTCETSRDQNKRDEKLVEERYGSLDCSLLDDSEASKPSLRPIQTNLFDEESSIDDSQVIVRKRSKSLGDKLDEVLSHMPQNDVLSPTSYQSSVLSDMSSVEEPIMPRLGISPRSSVKEQSDVSPHVSSMLMIPSSPLSIQHNTPASFVRPVSGGNMSSSGVLFTSTSPRSLPRPERKENDTQATVSVAARKAWVHDVLLAPKSVPFAKIDKNKPTNKTSPSTEPPPVDTPVQECEDQDIDVDDESNETAEETPGIQLEGNEPTAVKRRTTPGTPTTHIRDLGKWLDVVESKRRKRSQSEDIVIRPDGVQKTQEGENASKGEDCNVPLESSEGAYLDCIDLGKNTQPDRSANEGIYVNASNSETVQDNDTMGKIRRNSFPSRLKVLENSKDKNKEGHWKYQGHHESKVLTPNRNTHGNGKVVDESEREDKEHANTVSESLNVAARAALLEKGKKTPVAPSPTTKLSPFEAHKLKFQKMEEQVQHKEQDENIIIKQPACVKPASDPEPFDQQARLAAWRQKLADRFSPRQDLEEGLA